MPENHVDGVSLASPEGPSQREAPSANTKDEDEYGTDPSTESESDDESDNEKENRRLRVFPVKHADLVHVRVSVDSEAAATLSKEHLWKIVNSLNHILDTLAMMIERGEISEDWEEESVYQLRKQRRSFVLPPSTDAQWQFAVCESKREFEKGLADGSQMQIDSNFGIKVDKSWVGIELDPDCNGVSTGRTVGDVDINIPSELSRLQTDGAPPGTVADVIRKCFSVAMLTQNQRKSLELCSGSGQLFLTIRRNMGSKIAGKFLSRNRDTLSDLQWDVYIDKSLSKRRFGFIRAMGSTHDPSAPTDEISTVVATRPTSMSEDLMPIREDV